MPDDNIIPVADSRPVELLKGESRQPGFPGQYELGIYYENLFEWSSSIRWQRAYNRR
jgi:hypothetical protein